MAREVVNATHGFQVVGEAETGEESVVAAGRLHPDLVLMDVHLPGIDRCCSCRRMTRRISRRGSLDRGAVAFIPKAAFGPDRLTDAWARAVRLTDRSFTLASGSASVFADFVMAAART